MSDRPAVDAARARMAAKAGISLAASKDVVRSAPTTEQGVPGAVLSPMGAFGGKPDWAYFVDDREFAAELQWPRSVEVNERMETTDAQVKGLLLATFLPVRRYRWEFDPAEARPEAIALAHEDLNLPVRGDETMAPRRGGFSHDRHLSHSLRAVGQGHYHFEEVLELRDDGLLHLKKLATRPPRSIIGIRTDDHGNLEAIEQMAGGLGIGGGSRVLGGVVGGVRTLEASRLLTYLWDTADDGDQVGRSVLRACYRNFLVKDALIRVDAVKHERNAMGIPWFEVDPAASQPQIEGLARKAEEIRASTVGGGAGPGKLRIAGVEGTLPDTIASIRYHDEQMAKALMQMLFNLGGDAASGARALGDTFAERAIELQGAIADWYCEATQAFIDKQIARNFGPDEASPQITYTRIETSDVAFTDLATAVKEGLVLVTPELRAYIEQRWKVPGQKDAVAPTPPAPEPEPPEEGSPPGTAPEAAAGRARPQPKRSALATEMLTTVARDGAMTWPQLARACETDSKNGTARRARDLLLKQGALDRADANGTAVLALGTNAAPELGPEPKYTLQRAALATCAAKYGMTLADFDHLVIAQRGRCAACEDPLDNVNIDHDHDTGEVRGLLCPSCNTAAGMVGDDAERLARLAGYMRGDRPLIAADLALPDRDLHRAPLAFEVAAQVDFAAMETTFLSGRETLVAAYRDAQAQQIAQLVAAVEAADGDTAALASLSCDPVDVDVLAEPMLSIAEEGVASAQAEHEAQVGVQAKAAFRGAEADTEALEAAVRERAEAASLTLAAGLSTSASKKAAAVSTLEPEAAAAAVSEHLNSLTDAALDEQLGGATQQSYNSGRRAYFRAAGPKTIYASELLDANTCTRCNAIDGEEWSTVALAEESYPIGGYVDCEGGLRCRGTLVAEY